jgi:DNA-binding PadR family transcriptional regulator
MAVLGIVIEQPNQTVSHIARALDERFVRSRFVKSTAYMTLPQMTRGRSIRVRRTYTAPGDDRSLDRYAATDRGHEVFRAWMFEPPSAVPAIREAVYGRIELARLEHLGRLIRIAREEEMIATDLYAAANERVRKHEINRKSQPARRTQADYEREIRETLLYVDPLHWSSRAALSAVIAEHLEEIAEAAGIDFEAPEEPCIDLEVRDG